MEKLTPKEFEMFTELMAVSMGAEHDIDRNEDEETADYLKRIVRETKAD